MRKIIATLGIAHSGTNLIKKIFLDLFHNQKTYRPYEYHYLGHNKVKDGKLWLDVNSLNRFKSNLLTAVFNYRNEFDRRLSIDVRRILGDGCKGWPPGATDIQVKDHKDKIVARVIELLTDTKEMLKTRNRCNDVLDAKKAIILKCKELGARPMCLAYEEYYENFDHIFDKLAELNVNISNRDRSLMKTKHSAESAFKKSRGEKDARTVHVKHNLLSNHVSSYRGEPYFWTKFMDFEEVFASLPAENQTYFLEIVKDHPHKNLTIKS
ncbi:hypothetical protein LCGC14_0426910 [marine sediment metagenome]|uniref:Uncharacterized protein n=1 Tax=marine sediment metagenome TaxID=412755 RepID=A0A0F9SVG2_9ZZZZ